MRLMLFCTTHYLVFLVSVFVLYWILPWQRVRVGLLLIASLFFYATWSPKLAFLVVATSLLDYALARGIEASTTAGLRKLLLGVSLTGNVGFLIYFKYANFFLDALQQALHGAGAAASFPVLQVVAPIGISFYTFEAISYVVDVYRRKIPAERNPFHFLLFITFFPHLVAGPIVRGRDFLPQVRRPKQWNWARLHAGVQLLVLGLFKKLAIADRLALYADPVFAHPGLYSGLSLWTGLVAFALQVYCDFSGYSDMALGSAHLLGYKLAPNFNLPFLSVNVSDLWRRWHISLSTWMRDYLFIPLGGTRTSRVRIALNLLLVMSLGGLWHGAGWGFLLWGFLHGCFLVSHRVFAAWCEGRPVVRRLLESGPGTILRIALTFGCFLVPLIFFRTASLGDAASMLRGLATFQQGHGSPWPRNSFVVLTSLVIIGHLFGARRLWQKAEAWLPTPALGTSYAVTVLAALMLSPHLTQAFFYFQF
jgi:alginate O-acetyltransferase complex protein AlgI